MKRFEFLLQGTIFLSLGFLAGYGTAVFGPRVVVDPPVMATLDCIFGHAAGDHRVPEPVPSRGARGVPGADVGTRVAGAPTWQADAVGASSPSDDLRARHERLGLEVGLLNTQLEELSRRDRERRIRMTLLERRDDPSDHDALVALRDEVDMIACAVDQLQAQKDVALDELSRLELVLGAASTVDAGRLGPASR